MAFFISSITWVSDRSARTFNRSDASQAAAFDISKTFDKVWHACPLHKLKSYGISEQLFGISLFLGIENFKWFWMGSCHKSKVPQHSINDSTLFLQYINDLHDDCICNITIYADDTTLYSKWEQASDLWLQLKLYSDLQETRGGSGFLISMLENSACFAWLI